MTARPGSRRLIAPFAAVLLALALAACQTAGGEAAVTPATPLDIEPPAPEPVDFFDAGPTETYRLGLQHFKRGEYGLAERYFRATVEKNPTNVEAWIGLAGAYDHIRRFELADRAYATAIRLSGETVQILNNQGQSYMLRADFRNARAKFRRALRLAPGNAVVINNIRILNANDPGLAKEE
jgi:Flp pilus assembly protein TadD